MNKLIKAGWVFILGISSILSGYSQTQTKYPGKVTGEAVFTLSSNGKTRYGGAEIPVKGLVSGRNIGIIGKISPQGELHMNLPDSIPDEMLDSRPGTDIKGCGLSTVPDIRLWKNDADFLLLVYVNREYTENGTTYHRGWNYATNKHQKVNSAEGYKWVLNTSAVTSSKQNKTVLILSSSPRKGGNSDLLCDRFMKGAKEAGHTVEKIHLNDMNIHFLTSQDYTDLSGASEALDDAPMIVEKMLSADVIVMATPVFFYAMSGQMKTMIDRTNERHREMENKEFYFIIAGANKNKEKFQPVVQEFRGFLEALKNPIERGVIYGTGVWEKGSVEQTPAMNEAYEMGKNI